VLPSPILSVSALAPSSFVPPAPLSAEKTLSMDTDWDPKAPPPVPPDAGVGGVVVVGT
jgi:hypothetical protein